MVSIQEFARLCRCSAQTLRYYDRIGLFHPRHVEGSSGYRYYAIEQIEEFFRIKELQEVGFSIREIQEMKGFCEEELMVLLDEKVAAQEELLTKTRALKQTYQKRKMELREEVREYQKMKEICVALEDNCICLEQEGHSYKVRMAKDAPYITCLLRKMQEQVMVNLDLCVFREQEDSVWDCCTLSGWDTVEQAVEMIQDIDVEKHPLAVHLFLISHQITLKDIQVLIEAVMKRGIGESESLFSVSLSKDHRNTYTMLYPL